MKAEKIGIKVIRTIDRIVNYALLVLIVALLAFAGYALWDSKQIYKAADKSSYEVYKPGQEDEGKNFMELQAINPEVIAWLDVYGTNIDYPVTQAEDNSKYVNTGAEGRYSLSGAIFLDADNSRDFSDFNSIIYGHHMDKSVMFGPIGDFTDEDVFYSHRYGSLFFDEKYQGLEFFAFIHADAYDRSVFTPNVGKEKREKYLTNLTETAIHRSNVEITESDRIVLLATCSSDSTNGRDVLVGKITDELVKDPFKGAHDGQKIHSAPATHGHVAELFLWPLLLALVLTIRIITLISRYRKRRISLSTQEAVRKTI